MNKPGNVERLFEELREATEFEGFIWYSDGTARWYAYDANGYVHWGKRDVDAQPMGCP